MKFCVYEENMAALLNKPVIKCNKLIITWQV